MELLGGKVVRAQTNMLLGVSEDALDGRGSRTMYRICMKNRARLSCRIITRPREHVRKIRRMWRGPKFGLFTPADLTDTCSESVRSSSCNARVSHYNIIIPAKALSY